MNWTIKVTNDPNYLAPRNSPWLKVCELAGEDTIPGLILAHLKYPAVCMPFWVFDNRVPKNNKLTVVLSFNDWVMHIKDKVNG